MSRSGSGWLMSMFLLVVLSAGTASPRRAALGAVILRFERQLDNVREGLRRDEFHRRGVVLVEQQSAGPGNNRMYRQVDDVEQLRFQERLRQLPMAEDEQIATVLLLELAYLRGNVTAH